MDISNMDISTIVNIVLAILSFILAMLSIALVIITLRQNNKILEAANRPYITIFFDAITVKNRQNYFILKNFGNTSGTINKFIYPTELKTLPQKSPVMNEQFDCIENMVLAPGQSRLFPFDIPDYDPAVFSFEITYHSNFSKNTYVETVTIDAKSINHIPVSRPYSSKSADDNLLNVLVEIAEKLI